MRSLRLLWEVLLALNTWRDIRKREIFPWVTGAGGLLAVLLRILWDTGGSPAADLLPGGCFLLAAVLSRGRVGAGDGIFLCAGGLCLGLEEILLVASLGLLLGIPAGLALGRRKNREEGFPFLPCLLGAYLIERIWL